MNARVTIAKGTCLLTDAGPALVTEIGNHAFLTRDFEGRVQEFPYGDLREIKEIQENGTVAGATASFSLLWNCLDEVGRQQALDRQEIVLTILTGYASGHAELSRKDEPLPAFDPANRLPLNTRVEHMSSILDEQQAAYRSRARSLEQSGESNQPSTRAAPRTLQGWIQQFRKEGLYGLVDKRRLPTFTDFESLDGQIKQVAEDEVGQLDGTNSTRNQDEIIRRIKLALQEDGFPISEIPSSTLAAYVSHCLRQRGSTTRANRSNKLRKVSHVSSYPGLRPGQVVAIDVTRADNLVLDPKRNRAVSVEIISAIDVATRVILAIQVVPRSANSFDAGLILYDVLRPFSMAVSPEKVDDWRWAGVPEHVGMLRSALSKAEELSERPIGAVGTHNIPGLLPDSVRVDNGSIFRSSHFQAICERLQIHLMYSRGSRPTDNSFVERWHETIQRCLQQVVGHKGRNTAQRGSQVGKISFDRKTQTYSGPGTNLLTARQLERHIREFITVDYHRRRHEGIAIATVEDGLPNVVQALSPIETFDALIQSTGKIDVLQRPDLIFDFLEVRWATIGHSGVELSNLQYDAPELDDFRNIAIGYFQEGTRKAPFFCDPRDASRIWFRHPKTDQILEVPWKQKFLLSAPMTDTTVESARKRIRANGLAPNAQNMQDALLVELNKLGSIDRLKDPELEEWSDNAVYSSELRFARAQHDHREVQDYRNSTKTSAIVPRATETLGGSSSATSTEQSRAPRSWPILEDLD